MRQVDKIKEPNSLNKQSNLGNSNFNSLNKGHKLLKLRNQSLWINNQILRVLILIP